jgi:UTP--glucose-1-phosphate uridylyltransferase
MLPATKAIPKEMLPIVNKPIIQLIVEEAVFAGFKEVILITHSSKSSVENHFDRSFELETTLEKRVKRSLLKEVKAISNLKISIHSIRQGFALGLGHAILCAKNIIQDEAFAVILPDMILKESSKGNNLSKLKKDYENSGNSQILLGKASKKEISSYGVVETSSSSIKKIVEKPSQREIKTNLFAVGRYVFNSEIFKYIEKKGSPKNGEIELSNAIQKFIKKGNIISFSTLKGKYYDCGNILGYLKAIIDFAIEDKDIGKKFKSHLKKII